MTKIKFLRIACLMSAATMFATCINSGTMAKYTSSGTASGLKLTVANWNVLVNDEPLGSSPISLEDLTWTILQEGTDTPATFVDNMIAPGTWGYVPIAVENKSEVDAKIIVDYTSLGPTTTGSDLIGMSFNVIVSSGEPSESDVSSDDSKQAEGEVSRGDTAYIYVCYKWEFGDDANNTEDTEKGKSSIDGDRIEVNFGTLKITAEQSNGA